MHKQLFSPLLLLFLMQPAHANVYTLISDSGLTDGYGFSGTVTTDGSLGTFSDAIAILEWNITLQTPGGNDGVVSQGLTSANSTILFSPVGSGDLQITATELAITNSGENQTTNIFFRTPTEYVTFEGPIDGGLHGFATVSDGSEDPSFSSFFIGDGVSAVFASRIPEPGSFFLGLLGAAVLGVGQRRR